MKTWGKIYCRSLRHLVQLEAPNSNSSECIIRIELDYDLHYWFASDATTTTSSHVLLVHGLSDLGRILTRIAIEL